MHQSMKNRRKNGFRLMTILYFVVVFCIFQFWIYTVLDDFDTFVFGINNPNDVHKILVVS